MTEEAEKPQEGHTSYLPIFIILAVFTGLEIAASRLPLNIRIPALVVLAVAKAALVLLYFMHLRSDSRLYAMFFVLGIILTTPLALIMTLVMPIQP